MDKQALHCTNMFLEVDFSSVIKCFARVPLPPERERRHAEDPALIQERRFS